jgi:hypothetical protein
MKQPAKLRPSPYASVSITGSDSKQSVTYFIGDEEDVSNHADSKPSDAEQASILSLVTVVGPRDVGDEPGNIYRNGQSLNHLAIPPASKAIDNSG